LGVFEFSGVINDFFNQVFEASQAQSAKDAAYYRGKKISPPCPEWSQYVAEFF
jgi:hypothetical protein